ncbi:MAG: sigma-E processing peptidase SpoIIGA [Lachnospiraceae bacterium]|nr:sigma-E processing peptidase SpoIIGA [Lachnospiraceae bacterium]
MIAIDVYFFLNLAFDLILLQAVLLRMKKRCRIRRLLLAALIGALWSCVILLNPGLPAAGVVNWLLCPLLMCRIVKAGTDKRETLFAYIWFYVLACSGSGLMNLISSMTNRTYRGPVLIAWMMLVQLVLAWIWTVLQRKEDDETLFCKTELICRGKRVELTGIWDTGNRLCSLTGRAVHVIDPSTADALFGQMDLLEWKGVQMVPFCAVGKEGCMTAVPVESMTVWRGKKRFHVEDPLLGVSETMFYNGKNYQIIISPREFR